MRLNPTPRWSDNRISLFLLTPELVSDAYVAWLADPEINRFLETRFAPQTRSSVKAFVSTLLASERDLFWGIHDKALDRHVGNIRLGPIDRHHRNGEIGIMIGDRAAWGRGVGRGAIALVRDIARDELGLRKLTAGCYASNIGSLKAFQGVGFTIEGRRPQQMLLDGQPEDTLLMGLLIPGTAVPAGTGS